MELSRRGLFGLLGGALLAKVVGPRLIAEPTAALWEAAKAMPPTPIVNTYVPLEQVCADVLRIVNQELKWLRLRQVSEDYGAHRRIGDAVHIRDPARLQLDWKNFPHPDSILETIRPVLLDKVAMAAIDLSTLDRDCPFGHLSKQYVEPAAYHLAEHVINGIRRHGGGQVLVTGALQTVDHIPKCVIARDKDAGLVIRAIEHHQPFHPERGWRPELRIEMLYGLG